MTTLKDYYLALRSHDWDYERSDDHERYVREFDKRRELLKGLSLSPAHAALFSAFENAAQYGGPKPLPPFRMSDRVKFTRDAAQFRVNTDPNRVGTVTRDMRNNRACVQWDNTKSLEYIGANQLEYA